MSYYAKYNIFADCTNADTAEGLANVLLDSLSCAPDRVELEGCTVSAACYADIDNEDFAALSKKFPGTLISAEYIGEDNEIGILYAKDGCYYSEPAEIKFPDFDESKLPLRLEEKTAFIQSFVCDDDLTKYTDSMLFNSGTVIATAEYVAGENKIKISLEVRGEVSVDYKGIRYHSPCEFPEELRNLIMQHPGRWDMCAPSGEENDDVESYLEVWDTNWFEAIWEFNGRCDGVMYEIDLSKDTKEGVKSFFDEIVKEIIT